MRLSRHLVPLLGLCAAAMVSSEAMASTITQNVSWTIERAGTKAGNKGADAALAAIQMATVLRQLEQ